jgi:hypothetical protein
MLGRLARGEKREAAVAAAVEMMAGVEGTVVLEPAASGPTPALIGSLFDSLVVYDELAAADPASAWPLLAGGGNRPGMSLADWLAPPPKRPRLVVLPGVQTAMATGLVKPPARPGEDLFVPAVDLIAAGSHTALVSRWRSGGGVATALVQEFLRETAGRDGLPPVEAWQRAVDVVTPERPDLEREPRLKQSGEVELADARHPLLWAGHLLVDCGGGVYDPPPAAAVPPAAPLAAPAQPQLKPPAPAVAPAGPMPPAILDPPPPREPPPPRADDPTPAEPPEPEAS